MCSRAGVKQGGTARDNREVASANVDLVRGIRAAWERGDFSSADWAHPEIEFVIVGGPAPGYWNGATQLARVWRDYLSTWEQYRAEPAEEYRELDADRVLVLDAFSARGKRSGLELGQVRTESAGLFHLREGKVVRIVHYFDRERAFADLGLGPDSS